MVPMATWHIYISKKLSQAIILKKFIFLIGKSGTKNQELLL